MTQAHGTGRALKTGEPVNELNRTGVPCSFQELFRAGPLRTRTHTHTRMYTHARTHTHTCTQSHSDQPQEGPLGRRGVPPDLPSLEECPSFTSLWPQEGSCRSWRDLYK